ncbi:integrating conjugative element protein [Castellaniella sp. S9]|uniref:integrating conjugative element protein n=1 Tax=Castellaniella sp. S9 TaxID=2993652 RepID=UPI0022B5AB9C|nr:integrating conjugative element protein [Castellaniella sp. S9]
MKPFSLAVLGLSALIAATPLSALQAAEPLIVVDDHGGVSALPYYEALNLQPRTGAVQRPPIPIPQIPPSMDAEAQMLPVRSAKLTPGAVARRVIEAAGLQPFFLIGDDEVSQAWLRRHAVSLRERSAAGLVVNVETAQGLERLRALAPGLQLWPVSADDLADRLGLRHYPALITATGIEQ